MTTNVMTGERTPQRRHRVLIAGAGVAGLEALIALRQLAGDRVAVTLVSPSDRFSVRAEAVSAAFGRPAPVQHDVATIAADHDARFVRDALGAVRHLVRVVLTRSGLELTYDSLLVAVGGCPRPHPGLRDALCFGGPADVPALAGLLDDVDAGRTNSLLFVVPPGSTWTLPLYEIALLTAEHAAAASRDVAITVVTPEHVPLGPLGHRASARVRASLEERGVRLRLGSDAERLEDGKLLDVGGSVLATGDRAVTLPVLVGLRMLGLPLDRDGFLPVDAYGAIRGRQHAYGAGDATTSPYKQGGLAAQQAEVAARSIARDAGADVTVKALEPVLRAHLAAGEGATWFRAAATRSGHRRTIAAETPLWRPPAKVAMPYLARYLERSDSAIVSAQTAPER